MRDPAAYYDQFNNALIVAEKLKLDPGGVNEAETRLRVVDEVLSVLGWAKADFHPERRTVIGNYTDYLLKSHRDPLLVVEAKRIGRTFYLPDKFRKRSYQASFLRSHGGQELKEAMDQAADYCNETGTRYAVVTNGWQWIIFRGLGEHPVPWPKFAAVAFADIESLRVNYIEFWNLLSKQSVLGGSLSRKFESKRVPPPEFVGRPNAAIQSNTRLPPLENKKDIRIFFEQYFGDITSGAHKDMMDYCFVTDTGLHEHQRELKHLLKEKKLQFEEEIESHNLSDDALRSLVETAHDTNKNARVVLVVGHVGAGKTTFLQRFFKKLENDHGYAKFILDLLPDARSVIRPESSDLERISRTILEEVSERYYNRKGFGGRFDPYDYSTLREIYHPVEGRLKRGIKRDRYAKNPEEFERDLEDALEALSKDSIEHLPKYINYVTHKTRKPFCLVLDNVDKASDEFQQMIYTFALRLAEKVTGVVMVSLRETTYYWAREKGFLDTRVADTVFRITAPNLKQVISRRLKFVKYLAQHKDKAQRSYRTCLNFSLKLSEHLSKLLLREDNSALTALTCLSGRSVRRAFLRLRDYGFSPLAWKDWSGEDAGQYLIRSLMLGDQLVYEESRSPIANLFAVSQDLRGSHFLLIRILGYLDWKRQSSQKGYDWVPVGDLVRNFDNWGYHRSLVMEGIAKLATRNLVEVDQVSQREEGEKLERPMQLDYGHTITLSPSGYYFMRYVAPHEQYHLLCAGDTTWYDELLYDKFTVEYADAIELAASSETEGDVMLNASKCTDYWFAYLRKELRRERVSFPGARIAWRIAIDKMMDEIVPCESSDEAQGANEKEAEKQRAESHRIKDVAQRGKKQLDDTRQLRLFSAEKSTVKASIADSMPVLAESTSYEGYKWIARILWALELARRANVNSGVNASEIASLITEWGNVVVHGTNTARFLRQKCLSGEFADLMSCTKQGRVRRWSISENGRIVFGKIFDSE